MRGYEITSLSANTQELIKKEGLDFNKDGLINRDNSELANLLSRTGKSDINELTYDSWFDAKKEDFLIGTWAGLGGLSAGISAYRLRPIVKLKDVKSDAQDLFVKYNGVRPKPVSLDVPRSIAVIEPSALEYYSSFDKHFGSDIVSEMKKDIVDLQENFDKNRLKEIEERKAWNKKCAEWKPKVPMKECLKKSLTKNKLTALLTKLPVSSVFGAASIFGLGLAAYLFTCNPGDGIAKWTGSNDYQPTERQRSKTEDKFRKLYGDDVELNEYTPQKGEYWISILKAKYGVDDKTAERMAHRIKDVVYEDSLAAKQTPVMYFPDSWTFEGKTYQYNDTSKADKTENYSEDVKTEMGKMNKDIKYE